MQLCISTCHPFIITLKGGSSLLKVNLIFWGLVLLAVSFILYYNSETPYSKYSRHDLILLSKGLNQEEGILKGKLKKEEENFKERISQMAKERKDALLEEPTALQELKVKIQQIKDKQKEVKNELAIRKNRSRQLYITGMILGLLVFIGGLVLVILK